MARKAQDTGKDIAIIEAALGRGVATKFNAGRVVDLEWTAEKRYALAILNDPKNDYLRDIASQNPDSVVDALLDASRLGLSLSPTTKHAYLVPYGGDSPRVTLCPSYIGMEQSVLRSGKVTLVQTDIVYENDTFERWTDSSGAQFKHVPARKDRGDFEGVYCLAKFHNGESHMEYMSADDVEACFNAAVTKNKGKVPPAWMGGFKNEMRKKCVVRRGAKHWPSDKHVDLVMAQMDKIVPMEFNANVKADEEVVAVLCLTEEDIIEIEAKLERVPPKARPVWVSRAAHAMGYPDGADTVPQERKQEMVDRLVERMNKVITPALKAKEKASGTA